MHSEAKIATGTALSGVVDLTERVIAAIHMPAAWTAASLTLQACDTATGTFQNVHDDAGAEVTIAAVAGRAVTRPPDKTRGLRFIKIRSGTAGAPVNQAADRTLKLALVHDMRS